MIVCAKIFPHRRINPDKGRVTIPDAPSPSHMPAEDRAVMRELIREEQAKLLAKRAEALTLVGKISHPPALGPRYTFYFGPELINAFRRLPREIWEYDFRKPDQRNGPSPSQAIRESLPWLKRFMRRERFFCRDCGIEITAKAKGRVPWQIAATGPLNGPYQINGLCSDCMNEGRDGMISYVSTARIICVEHNPKSNNE